MSNRNADPKNFVEYYHYFCKENKVKSKVQFLQNDLLEVKADRLEKNDWIPLIKALTNDTTSLHSIKIVSKFLNKDHNDNKFKRWQNQVSTEPPFLKQTLYFSIMEAITICITNSKLLCSVHLEGFQLNKYYCDLLRDSIEEQLNLQHLALPYCKLKYEDLILLMRTICIHTGLISIDLTGCGLTYDGAQEVAAVIRAQKLARYGETWKQSLRYRLPKPEILPGLRRVTLNNNERIGDEGFKLISYELMDDLWIRAIDFQNCGITNSSIEYALDLIRTNSSICILDIRRNCIEASIIKHITHLLKSSSVSSDGETFEWINTDNSSTSFASNKKFQSYKTNSSQALRTYSCPDTKQPRNTNLKQDQKQTGKVRPSNVISELKQTKQMLHQVSSSLIEEKNKRETIEKEHEIFKKQLKELHKNYLNQNNLINNKINCSQTKTTSASTETTKSSPSTKVQTQKTKANTQNKNKNTHKKIFKQNRPTSNVYNQNRDFLKKKFLLVVPSSLM